MRTARLESCDFLFRSYLDSAEAWDDDDLRAFFPDDDGRLRAAAGSNRSPGLSYQVLLAEDENGSLSMVDAGNGFVDPAHPGALAELLEVDGVDPARVDRILLTHFHSDHIGGLVDSRGRAAFPRAILHVLRPEWDYWADFVQGGQAEPWRKNLLERIASGYGDRLRLHAAEASVAEGIRLIPAPGHTRGHATVSFGGPKGLIHAGDLIHLPAQFLDLGQRTQYDQDPAAARESRRAFAQASARDGPLVFLNHADYPGFGRVRAEGSAFRWEQRPACPSIGSRVV